jgi:versiconal hemiacetal acetate esterase
MPLLHGPVENLCAGYNKMIETIVGKFEIPPTDTSIRTEDIQVSENYKVRVYHPPGATGNDPLGIYIHGGGWTICDLDSEDAICRTISKSINIVLVSVDYRLGPEHKFPAALDDCVDAFSWALTNYSKLGISKSNVVIIGGSAGGNLAIGSALKLIDEGKGAPISGVVALVPVTIHPDVVPDHLKHKFTAYEENAELTLNTKSAMLEFWSE